MVPGFDLKILVVEDNAEISEALAFFCSAKKDIDCEAANTGRQGLDRIRKEDFELILLDLAMPEFSGIDVIRSLAKDQLAQANIVIFTASSDPATLQQMKNTGVKEVFRKPFSLEQLTALIDKYRPKA